MVVPVADATDCMGSRYRELAKTLSDDAHKWPKLATFPT